jgi:hypothetical protein
MFFFGFFKFSMKIIQTFLFETYIEKNLKNPKNQKKQKNQKNPLGWFIFKKPGFFPTLGAGAAPQGRAGPRRAPQAPGRRDKPADKGAE